MLVFIVDVDKPWFDGTRIANNILLVNDVVRGLYTAVSGTILRVIMALLTMRYKDGSEVCEELLDGRVAIAGNFTPGMP